MTGDEGGFCCRGEKGGDLVCNGGGSASVASESAGAVLHPKAKHWAVLLAVPRQISASDGCTGPCRGVGWPVPGDEAVG